MTTKEDTRTAADLLDGVWEQIELLRKGETTPATVNAMVAGVGAVLRVVKLQMVYAEKTGKTPNIPLLLTSQEKKP